MAVPVLSRLLDRPASNEIDGDLKKQLEKARARHNVWKPRWAEPLAFIEGRQFVFRIKSHNSLGELDIAEGGAKPGYIARTTRNRIVDYWLDAVSAGTQRVPQPDVTPTNTDPDVIAAAMLSAKVARHLHTVLRIQRLMVQAYGYAVACGEGFLYPYWDSYQGDRLPDDPESPGEVLYTGQLCVIALGPHEVGWAPGATFEESPYHFIERAMQISKVKEMPGYIGGDLKPDCNSSGSFVQGQLNKQAAKGDMVMVTEWLEKPTERNPAGRRLFLANDKKIVPDEGYPLVVRGEGGFEACLHKVTYIPTAWRDRDMGLVEHLIDAQRTLNDCVNKGIMWKNLVLQPQVLSPRGARLTPVTAEPGKQVEYDPISAQTPKFRDVPDVPQSLDRMRNQAIEDMEAISSQRSLPAQVESGKGQAAFIEQEQRRDQLIIQGLADFYSRLFTHLLIYVQEKWSEPQLLKIQGRDAVDYIPDFKGADLKGQTSVRVLPTSIEPLTRQAIEQKVMNLVQAFPGQISKEEAIAAIEAGTWETLIEDYDLDVSKQQREIEQMIALGNEQLPGGQAPDAAPWDNHDVHLQRLHRWMKTRDFEESHEVTQAAAMNHEAMHQQLIADEQARAQAAQAAQAEQAGMSNAANGSPKPMPSLPAVNS